MATAIRASLRSGLAILCSLLLGCSGNSEWQPPTVVVDTPTGVTPIYSPAPVMPGGIAGPPPGLENSALAQPTRPVSRDGSYAAPPNRSKRAEACAPRPGRYPASAFVEIPSGSAGSVVASTRTMVCRWFMARTG